jgi:hypothetical protein
MAVQRVNPNADVTITGWDGATAHHSQVGSAADLLVTDPAAGNISTTSEYVASIATNDTFTVAMETFDITGQDISQIVARSYSRSGTGGTLQIALMTGGTVLASNTQAAGNTAGWLTCTYTGDLTQGELDDLRIRMTLTTAGSANARVGVLYADVTYAASAGGTVRTLGSLGAGK